MIMRAGRRSGARSAGVSRERVVLRAYGDLKVDAEYERAAEIARDATRRCSLVLYNHAAFKTDFRIRGP